MVQIVYRCGFFEDPLIYELFSAIYLLLGKIGCLELVWCELKEATSRGERSSMKTEEFLSIFMFRMPSFELSIFFSAGQQPNFYNCWLPLYFPKANS